MLIVNVDETRQETIDTVSREIMDQVMVEEDTAGDTPVEATVPEECIWRQNITINDSESDTSGIETVLENEASACKVMATIHGEFSVNPETVCKSKECFDEMHDDFLEEYKVEITDLKFVSSEQCNMRCRFGKSCSTVTSVEMTMKKGENKFPNNEFTFGDIKSFNVAFPAFASVVYQD